MIVEDLALDELLGTKTRLEREAQAEFGGKQMQPIADSAGKNTVLPSSGFSDGNGRKQRG